MEYTLVPRTETLPFLKQELGPLVALRGQVWAGPEGGNTLKNSFLTALKTALASCFSLFPPHLQLEKKKNSILDWWGDFCLALFLPPSVTSPLLFSVRASLEVGRREPSTCQRWRRRCLLQSSPLFHLLQWEEEKEWIRHGFAGDQG